MANLTTEQLVEYDNLIKNYIEEKIQEKTEAYEVTIKELNETIMELQQTIDNSSTNTSMLRSIPMLRSIVPETIVVQEDIQEDYIIYDRVISPNENKVYKNIVVTSDNKSNRIYFSMWKTFDNIDLIDKNISVVWINADELKGETMCEDKHIFGNRSDRSWM